MLNRKFRPITRGGPIAEEINRALATIAAQSQLRVAGGARGIVNTRFGQPELITRASGLIVRKNSTGSDFGPHRRLNLIEGSNITLTVAADTTNDEIDVTIAASGGGGSITIEEVDGTPTESASTLRFDSADGFELTEPAAGVVRVDMLAAGVAQVGVVTTGSQTFAGAKTFNAAVACQSTLTVQAGGTFDTNVTSGVADNHWLLFTIADGTPMGKVIAMDSDSGGTIDSFEIQLLDGAGGDTMLVMQLKDGRLSLLQGADGSATAPVYNIRGTDGVSGTFTTADAKTVTVTGGIVTSIV